MNITSVVGANTGMQPGMKMGNNMQTDSVSKNIQNQIANAQKRMQDLSADKEMSIEDKMKKRQEIQQEITSLNQQLRQHQMEQKKEKQQKASSMDDMLGGSRKVNASKAGSNQSGLSQASMQTMSQATMVAIISADSSMKQAQVQGATATKMEGRAGVLESEIKLDQARGGSTEAKEAELAEVEAKAQAATSAQLSTLADANKTMEEAAKADREDKVNENKVNENKTDKTEGKSDKNTENKVDAAISGDATTEGVSVETAEVPVEQVSTAQSVPTENISQPTPHVSVDIRL